MQLRHLREELVVYRVLDLVSIDVLGIVPSEHFELGLDDVADAESLH